MPPRGRGGKFSKPSRGGGKHFSRDLQPIDKDGVQVSMWRDPADQEESSEEEEEESSEEEESEDDGPSTAAPGQELSREQRKELAKKKKLEAIAKKNAKVAAPGDLPTDSEEESEEEEEEGDLPANPNHTSKARNQARAATGASGESPKRAEKGTLSRREKEALAAQQAKERYQKLHAEGKTDEARADLARLKLIREQREAAAARKQAEKEEEEERKKENADKLSKEEAKRAAALGTGDKKGVKGGKKK